MNRQETEIRTTEEAISRFIENIGFVVEADQEPQLRNLIRNARVNYDQDSEYELSCFIARRLQQVQHSLGSDRP